MAISNEEKKILNDFLAQNGDLLCAVIDELDIDPAVKAAVKTGIKHKYQFEGNIYGVGPLVLAVVKKDVSDHPGITFTDLQKAFPDKLISTTYGVVKPKSIIPDKHKGIGPKSYKRYFDEIIPLDCGDEIMVCREWSKEKIPDFIQNAQKLGYSITQV